MRFKFITPDHPDYHKSLMLRWEEIQKILGLPPGSEQTKLEQQGIHLLAFDGKEIVGCLFFHVEEDSKGRIHHLAVSPEYEGPGFGRRFVSFLEKSLHPKGIREIYLKAMKHQLPFYQRMGFEPHGSSYEMRGVAYQEMLKVI